MSNCLKYLIATLVVLLSSCQGEDSIYRGTECFFLFDTSLHPQPCLLTGIIGNPGQFCKIENSIVQGVIHLKATRNYDGATEDIRLTTERENQYRYALGEGNCIIIGTNSFDNLLIAYEGQCSNCLSNYGGTRYPLIWGNNGQELHCAKCGRSYDVNNGTVASGEGGIQLYRYQAAFDGKFLRAWN